MYPKVKTSFLLLFGAAAFCAGWLTLPAAIQDGPRIEIAPAALDLHPRPAPLRAAVDMVIIPALVRDQEDRPVLDLRKEEFRLFEGDREQKIQFLARDDAPASIGIVFDTSGSMAKRIATSRDAVGRLLRASLPEDEFFLVQFSDLPRLVVRFTPLPNDILASLNTLHAQGWTSMFDGIYLAINQMRYAKNSRKALVILSDGGDNNSRYTQSEVVHALREADVRVFAIGLFEKASFLRKAADETGGSVIAVRNMKDLDAAVQKIEMLLRSEYLLGYYPPPGQNDERFHKVKVTVNRTIGGRKLLTTWRHGYYGR